jgi:hypothetical protein
MSFRGPNAQPSLILDTLEQVAPGRPEDGIGAELVDNCSGIDQDEPPAARSASVGAPPGSGLAHARSPDYRRVVCYRDLSA